MKADVVVNVYNFPPKSNILIILCMKAAVVVVYNVSWLLVC